LYQIRQYENNETFIEDNNYNYNNDNNYLESKKTNYDLIENDDNENIVLNQSVFDKNDKYKYNSNNNNNIRFDSKSIFGELINEQEERIRKFSPYGKFKTWKICRIIGKIFFNY
jgi:hypothetical protein